MNARFLPPAARKDARVAARPLDDAIPSQGVAGTLACCCPARAIVQAVMPARFTVTVKDGIVTMEGEPGSIVLGRNIVDQARHVEGVVAVRDRLTYLPATEAS